MDTPSAAPLAEFVPQPLESFLAKALPPKEALIEEVLYRRDRVSLTGRRRGGKTTLIHNLALAGAAGLPHYLGYRIPEPFRVLSFYLEDDARELQDKLRRMSQGLDLAGRFHLYTRDDFWRLNTRIDAQDSKFQDFVKRACDAGKLDLVMFDNLAHLIGADYNNSERVHALMLFMFSIERDYNAATLIAAHPRKGSPQNIHREGRAVSLRQSPEQFFEECMGTSHFINTTGSLWGIERNHSTGRSDLLLGTQRLTGTHSFTVIEKNDLDWFEPVEDLKIAAETLINTPKRRQAWDLMAQAGHFDYMKALELVRPAMKSSGSFNPWWNELLRHGLVRSEGEAFTCAEVTLLPICNAALPV